MAGRQNGGADQGRRQHDRGDNSSDDRRGADWPVGKDNCPDSPCRSGKQGVHRPEQVRIPLASRPRPPHPCGLETVLERLEAARQRVDRTVRDEDSEERGEQDEVERREPAARGDRAAGEEGREGQCCKTPNAFDGATLPAIEERAHPSRAGRLEGDPREQHHQSERQPACAGGIDDEVGGQLGFTSISTAIATIAAASTGPTILVPRIASA